MLLVSCVPADGSTPTAPTSTSPITTPTGSASSPPPPSSSPAATPSRSAQASTTPEPTPSLPAEFAVSESILDGGAALVVRELHEISGLRPALKLDISENDVTLTVLSIGKEVRSYRWRDGIIELAETDVEYLRQTSFWPTDFELGNVRRIFDVAALLGTSSNGQVLQVVEYRPGRVYMSVTTTPESNTIFFRKDGTVFRDLGRSSVADIRDGLTEVAGGSRQVYKIGFDGNGYYAELPVGEGVIERRSRMAHRPMFSSQRSGTSSMESFDPRLIDPSAIAETIAAHSSSAGCNVQIDNSFERVQPVVTYQCDGETFHSDLRGTDLTNQLR